MDDIYQKLIDSTEDETQKKMFKVYSLLEQNHGRFFMFEQFFDCTSENMLDEKIQVLTDLANGKTIAEIPNFYDILEKYPSDGTIWD